MSYRADPVRVLVVPGLHDSGPTHWQTWLEQHFKRSVRVAQDDWSHADLAAWSDRIDTTLAAQPQARWVAVAHSFGCLALARTLAHRRAPIDAALLVAPADPDKFGAAPLLPDGPLGIPSALLASENDPWMQLATARRWAGAWGAQFINLGAVGHINTDAGFGPLPQAKALVETMIHRVERGRRPGRAHPLEFSFAI